MSDVVPLLYLDFRQNAYWYDGNYYPVTAFFSEIPYVNNTVKVDATTLFTDILSFAVGETCTLIIDYQDNSPAPTTIFGSAATLLHARKGVTSPFLSFASTSDSGGEFQVNSFGYSLIAPTGTEHQVAASSGTGLEITAAIDGGAIQNFVGPSIGWGTLPYDLANTYSGNGPAYVGDPASAEIFFFGIYTVAGGLPDISASSGIGVRPGKTSVPVPYRRPISPRPAPTPLLGGTMPCCAVPGGACLC